MHTTVSIQLKQTSSNTIASCSLPVNEEVEYKIYNSEGKIVFSKSIILINTGSKVMEDLDVSELAAGNYLLYVSVKEQTIKKINITI